MTADHTPVWVRQTGPSPVATFNPNPPVELGTWIESASDVIYDDGRRFVGETVSGGLEFAVFDRDLGLVCRVPLDASEAVRIAKELARAEEPKP